MRNEANRGPKDAIVAKPVGWGAMAAAVTMAALAALWLTPGTGSRAEGLDRAGPTAASVRSEPSELPVANAARLEENGDKAKLVFELSAPVEASAFALAGPNRVIVDLPRIEFALDSEVGKAQRRSRHRGRRAKAAGIVASFRFGQLEQGKSRIVIDLAAPAQILRAECDMSGGDAKPRLIIELAKTDRAAFRASVQTARAALSVRTETKQAQKFEAAAGKPVVMIDPGHGGIDSGARVNGLVEKDLVFAFAKAVAAKLEADGRFATVMTRDDDSFVPLSQRVKMARDGKAALFISIHADVLSEAADVAGATVYTVSDRASDAEAARVAEKENQSDAAAGLDGTEDASDVSDILFDLTRRETRAYSHLFARTLVNYWKVAGRLNKNPHRSAGFRVLKAPDVPSVLLELGYLSNDKDDFALTSAEWRDKASTRVAEAIGDFFSQRGGADSLTSIDKGRSLGGSSTEDKRLDDSTAALRAPLAEGAGKPH